MSGSGLFALRRVAPNVNAAILASRGFFPFGLSWEPLPCPFSVGSGVVKGNVHHRVMSELWRHETAFPINGRFVAGGIEKFLVLGMGHLEFVDVKGL